MYLPLRLIGEELPPFGFTIDGQDAVIKKVQAWRELLLPYGIYEIKKGFGGVDIKPLKEQSVPLCGLAVDAHRYFQYHHCANDTFGKLSNKELQLGSTAIASLIFLIDKYGL